MKSFHASQAAHRQPSNPSEALLQLLRLVLSAALTLLAWEALAVEPWSDPRLPVTNGVAMWFDASRQTAGRGAQGLTPLRSWADAPEILFDGSGHRRDLTQPLVGARPTYRIDWGTTALAFDGVDDHLASGRMNWALREATVFVVANPHEVGGYRGLLSANAIGRNDYLSGFNLDFGSAPSTNLLSSINVEGPGFTGERSLLGQPVPLNRWHRFTVTVGGSNGIVAYLDGQLRGTRPRDATTPLSVEEFTLGARRYSNTPVRPHAQGFFKGWLTEVLVYDRVLPEAERQSVESYLDEKYGSVLRGMGSAPQREGAVPLTIVSNPPPVRVFASGFQADRLPVELNNVNNVRYRPDGRLLAIGYDGRLWLLKDSDGDGLEDRAALFFDGRNSIRAPVGAALTPPGYTRGNGVFVPGKDRLALVVDTDGDDRADQDITVATWTERSIQQGVDALGVAVAADGTVFFSLGSASFVEPFLIDGATGRAGYRTTQERGTILKVSPDFSKREIVASGIRFAVGLAFNRHGDLFATDQEGATWRHDGNPLDELLHIQPGRHYGFPPRHPAHLPGVFDEPSVFDYAPQHQSVCGLQFNEPVAGGPVFGPPSWAGDALVTGYSRGKVWRTKLVRTATGYVAQTHLLATLQSMAIDACVSPRGDLIVATHSGQPDWGSGPNGKGELWRIRYADRDRPQIAAAWNASATEIRIAFDRSVDPAAVRRLASQARIEGGHFVFPGDRFETIRPGYQVVYDQLAAPRYSHEILTSRLSPDRRTLTLVTRPRDAAVNYAVTLPAGVESAPQPAQPASGAATAAPEHPPTTELLTTLQGIEARWEPKEGTDGIDLWLPHPDLAVARALTAGSADHDRFFDALARPGRLTLRGQLDLWQMLQPAIQPGAAIDWVRPSETVRVRFESGAEVTLRFGSGDSGNESPARTVTGRQAEITQAAPGERWHPFEISLNTGGEVALTANWSTDEDPRPRALPLRRFYQSWAKPASQAGTESAPGERVIPELAGARWLHGRRLFFGDRLGCAKCHAIRGEGTSLGPELSNLVHRDYASVRRDVEFPNAAINPDHVSSQIERRDAEVLTGIALAGQEGLVRVATAAGAILEIPRADILSIRPSALSLMPEGLWTGLTATEQRDLMSFLLTQPLEPHPAPPEAQGQRLPAPRSIAKIRGALDPRPGAEAASPASPRPLRIVLCASAKDAGHGAPGFHDYPLWRERWTTLLGLADEVTVEPADRWPEPEQWTRADVVAFYHDNPAWAAERAADLDAFLKRGGGLIFLHWSINAYRDLDPLKHRLWRAWGAGAKFRYGIEPLRFAPHPLTAGFPEVSEFTDEAYWNLPGGDGAATVLATSVEDGAPTPQVWLKEEGRGRVLVCIPGHFTWTFDDPLYRALLLRGFAWAAREPLDRFHELTTVGARFEP